MRPTAAHMDPGRPRAGTRSPASRAAARAPGRPGCRTDEKRNEFAPVHSITSSARASSAGGSSNPIDLAVLRLAPGHVRYGCGRDDARTTGTAPHNCADRQRAVALALPQREKLGVDDVIGLGISAGAESGRAAYPRSRL